MTNAIEPDTILFYGGAVKALGDGKVGGYLVRFSTDADPDLEAEFFDAATDYGSHTTTPIYYNHGLDPELKQRQLGKGELQPDDVGVWVQAQLELRDRYERAIYEMAEAGKLGWSSGTAPHLVGREAVGKAHRIASWPLGLDASLTPTPAEPRTRAIPLKSLIISQHLAIESEPETDIAETDGASVDDTVSDDETAKRIRVLSLELDLMEIEHENGTGVA